MAKLQLLKKVGLFEKLNETDLALLEGFATEQQFSKGELVFREFEEAHSIYMIEVGKVEILKEGPGGARMVVAEIGQAGHFGEMAFIDRARRAATAQAKEDLELLTLSYDHLQKLIAGHPSLGLKIYQGIAETLCSRIRRTTSDLSSLLLS